SAIGVSLHDGLTLGCRQLAVVVHQGQTAGQEAGSLATLPRAVGKESGQFLGRRGSLSVDTPPELGFGQDSIVAAEEPAISRMLWVGFQRGPLMVDCLLDQPQRCCWIAFLVQD